jgi:probable HAF family extracellular repeat protein
MKRATHIVVRALLSASVLSSLATVGWSQQPSITWLGTLGGRYSFGHAVSADGKVVVGYAHTTRDDGRQFRAFRWTAETGMVDLGNFSSVFNNSWAWGVSADGSVVVGYAHDWSGYNRPFRWTPTGGMVDLGTYPGGPSGRGITTAVSADGTVAVGLVDYFSAGTARAFRWTVSGGMQQLSNTGNFYEARAFAVSADGSVVAGTYYTGPNAMRAFRWENGVVQDLGDLGAGWSVAQAISADGTTVIGWSDHSNQRRSFRWKNGQIQDFGFSFEAYAVSADGSIVVGRPALRWREPGIVDNLNATYASILGGSVLYGVRGMSPNGRYLVGTGYNAATNREEAFLLDTGFPLRGDVDRNGCVDDADLLQVLFAFGERGYRNEDLNWDGIIDDADLLQVLFNFGSGC